SATRAAVPCAAPRSFTRKRPSSVSATTGQELPRLWDETMRRARTRFTSEVSRHQPLHPLGDARMRGSVESGNVGLDVQDRGAVDGVEPAHDERPSLHALDTDGGDADRVRPVTGALGEDPDSR